jgi:predicted permease
VSASFFPLMGTLPALGRTLLPRDDERGVERVAVMSHGTWVRRFAADPAVIGRPLRSDDGVYTIVGVMPQGFDYPKGAELWVPLVPQIAPTGDQTGVDLLVDTGIGFLYVLGRLNVGITIDSARDEVAGLLARNRDVIPAQYHAVWTPLDEHIFGTMRPALIALAACVGLVLLIACANVAVLLLARAAARIQETATRLAIGATRWHIVRQSLADALLLSSLASAAGLALAYRTVDVLVAAAPADLPRLDAVGFDAATFAFAGVVCLTTTVLIGAASALQISRWSLTNVLGHHGVRVVRSHRLRRAFLVAQVTLAIVPLVCGGLVARSVVNLLRVNIGFEPLNVLTLDVTVPDVPVDRYNRFYTALLARVRSMPDVAAAGAIHLRPLAFTGIGSDVRMLIEGQRADVARDWEGNPAVNFESVTPGYFQAMGIRVLRGRDFTDADTDRAPLVALASAGLAQRLWPGQDPIGRRILPSGATDAQGVWQWSTVVGIVEDARYRGLTDPRFDLYVPYRQRPDHAVKHLMVRASREPLSLVDPIRAEARRLEPTALVENISTMDQLVGRTVAPWRFSASTLGLLAVLALSLASLGVYAIVTQSVQERRREIGVRVAVGALPRQIASLVLRDTVSLTAAGIAIGLALGIGAGRVLSSLLYDVQPADPLTLSAMAALFLAVSTSAILVPVWRAIRVDPVQVLRQP